MTTAALDLDRLRELVEAAKLESDLATLKAQTHAMKMAESFVGGRRVREGWGDEVPIDEPFRDGAGMSYFGDSVATGIARPTDRRFGDNFPFWQSEAEHRTIIGQARLVASRSEVALAALENLTNYTIGDGFGYSFAAKDEDDTEARKWAELCQRISDNFDEANGFTEDGERSLFERSRQDGEFFACLTHRGGSNVSLRQVDPCFITEPDNRQGVEEYAGLPTGLEWKYGVAADQGDPTRVHAYFAEWNGDANDWDVIPPESMVHLKLNVSPEVKRGLSDYYAVHGNLTRGEKLLGNTLEGAAGQAAIAYIREHAMGTTSDAISDMVVGAATKTITETTDRGGQNTRNIRNAKPGEIHDVTAGTKYQAGPMGSPNGPRFVEVVQAAMRMVGIRWAMPEYMISGDASNGNFASTLVAEAPFTKATEARQSVYSRKYREIKWKAVGIVAKRTGLFGNVSLAKIKRRVQLTVDTPEVAVRNRVEDHTIKVGEHAAGILSLDTWAAEVGRELAEEQRKGAKPTAIPNPVATTPPPSAPPSVRESWLGYP